jgi:hypothetical protein
MDFYICMGISRIAISDVTIWQFAESFRRNRKIIPWQGAMAGHSSQGINTRFASTRYHVPRQDSGTLEFV